jgi:transcriptional enhancer factor
MIFVSEISFESKEPMTLSCSTKVCSFGNQVVEKVESERASYESDGKYVYRFENSPMCEYMVTFINKLKQLPEKHLKNSVLENFSVLQVR